MLTFSAFPDLMWQQRSKIENLFHFPSSFAILMFLLSSLLCKHEAFYLLSPTSTRRKKRFGIRCWNLGWGGETWPLSRHGSTLQGDGNQELNIGADLCTHFAWKGAARLERPWLIGKGVSTRKPGPMPILRRWPLYSIYFVLFHILTHFLITWSCGNRPVIQVIFVLIAAGFPRHLAYVQKEGRRAFMGVKFYDESYTKQTTY